MNKPELISTLAEKSGLEKSAVEKLLDSFESTVIKELKSGHEVALTGFGTFMPKFRAARMGVNPRNPSEKIQMPAVTVPKFKAGKTLKDALKHSGSAAPVTSTEPATPDEEAPTTGE